MFAPLLLVFVTTLAGARCAREILMRRYVDRAAYTYICQSMASFLDSLPAPTRLYDVLPEDSALAALAAR